jgi:hypothetical protein
MGVKLTINARQSDNMKPVQEIEKFNSIDITLEYDSIASKFEFEMAFDPNNKKDAEIASVSHIHEGSIYYVHDKPGKFKDLKYRDAVTTNELLITGFLLSQGFRHSAAPNLVKIGGYSKPGALEDSDIPIDKFPLESNGKSFKQIAQSILKTSPGKKGFNFGFRVDKLGNKDGNTLFVESKSVDEDYEKSTAPESKSIKEYLSELATQKDIILSHTPQGDLLVTAPNINGKPILDIKGIGFNGVIDLDLVYNGQPLHSEITVVRQADEDGGNAAEYTILNPLVPIVYRPKVVSLTSGNDITVEKAALNELRNELKAISLIVTLDRGAVNGKFIFPNNIITVTDREIYLYEKTRWIIGKINFREDASGEKMVLTCYLPAAFGGPVNSKTNPFIDPHHNLPPNI